MMGQESRSAQKIMRQINVASWQNEPWTAACRHMQEKAHIQLRPCYSFLDRWSALSFSLLWLWFFDFFLSVPPVNGFDAGDQRIRTLVRLKEYVWWLAFRLAFGMRLFWQTPPLCLYCHFCVVSKLKRTAFVPSSTITSTPGVLLP